MPRQNTCANDGICNDIGGGNGQCNQGSLNYCDGITRSDGSGFLQCNNNADCSALGSVAGDCALSTPQPCFLNPITATGVQDPNAPVTVSAFCVAPTSQLRYQHRRGIAGTGPRDERDRGADVLREQPVDPVHTGSGRLSVTVV